MKNLLIKFQNEYTVPNFVKLISPIDADFELRQSNFILDAKSLMGIYSLDFTKPITLRVDNFSGDIDTLLKDYIIKE